MRFVLVLLLVLAAALAPSAQNPLPGLALVTSVPSTTLSQADFTVDCAYRVPRVVSGAETIYGTGLTVREEATDATTPIHLVSAAFGPGGVLGGTVYEWADPAPCPAVPGSPYDVNNYTQVPIAKVYGNIYGTKRQVVYMGTPTSLTAALDGWQGLFVHPSNWSRLYWTFNPGYFGAAPGECNSWSLGYSDLNFTTGGSSPAGPWGFTGQSFKAFGAAVVDVPQTFATTYTGGRRLGVGIGGYYSLIGACDASLGPSLNAIDFPAGAAEQSYLANTPLVGFWPATGSPVGMVRPTPFIESPVSPSTGSPGGTRWWWLDRARGAVWIHGASKSGLVVLSQLGMGQANYISSNIAAEYHRDWWMIFSEASLASVATGAAARNTLTPTNAFEQAYPPINTAVSPYSAGTVYSVASISSPAGSPIAVAPCAGAPDVNGATVTLTTPDAASYANNAYISLRGSSSAANYDAIWQVEPGSQSGATLRIYNCSLAGNWSGAAATGGTARSASNAAFAVLGIAYHAATNKLWVAISVQQGVNNLSGHVIIVRYSVAS